ncbi:MAG: T9SS type A sorting domain-containing protein, partial [Calditrichaeota bacterium]|nr:T9SS type A sorting domain-containing protein [Calditrichota bacterium]
PNLRLDFQAYFLPANLSRAEAEELVEAIERPVVVRTRSQTYGQTRVAGAGAKTPARFAVQPAFPNPFNSSTQIRFDLPRESRVQATVVDQLGRTRRVLFDGKLSPGRHRLTWNGTDGAGRDLPSGTYLLRVRAGNHVISRK